MTDRESRGASHIAPSRADIQRHSETRHAGSKCAEEAEATELRTLLTRLGDGAEEAAGREKARRRKLRAVAAGSALALVSAGAGVGLTLLFGGLVANGPSETSIWSPAAALPKVSPAVVHVEPQPESKAILPPAVHAAVPVRAPIPDTDPVTTAGIGLGTTAAVPRTLDDAGSRDQSPLTSPATAVASPAGLSEAEIAAQLARAEGMLKNGDLAAARSFFRRIADAGDARGALGMAQSYDPEFLKRLGMHGLRSDRAAAQDWYARARSMKNEPRSE